MQNKVQQFILKEKLFEKHDQLIIGLSGGADSVVLLHLLNKLGYDCVAAHCNFHLRGEESARDEEFASSFAQSLQIPFYKKDFDTRLYASKKGISIEMAARELRYEWFEQLKNDLDAKIVAVAHHQDDNIETIILNLVRGTGIKGLTGIKPKTGDLVRPLLCLSKEEILSYASDHKLTFVTDSSNLQDEFVRNKIRLQVLPLLQTINPSVREALLRTISNLQQVSKLYTHSIAELRSLIFDPRTGTINIPLLKSTIAPEALLFEILSEYGFGRSVIGEVAEALDSSPGKVFYSENYRLIKDRETFLLKPRKQNIETMVFEIKRHDKMIFQPLNIEIFHEQYHAGFEIKKDKHIAYLDADQLTYPLKLRKWQQGDCFIPFGMKQFKKLSDYFNDHKYSKIDKENTWLLCSENDIVWIVGERIDNRFSLNQNSRNCCVLKLF